MEITYEHQTVQFDDREDLDYNTAYWQDKGWHVAGVWENILILKKRVS